MTKNKSSFSMRPKTYNIVRRWKEHMRDKRGGASQVICDAIELFFDYPYNVEELTDIVGEGDFARITREEIYHLVEMKHRLDSYLETSAIFKTYWNNAFNIAPMRDERRE